MREQVEMLVYHAHLGSRVGRKAYERPVGAPILAGIRTERPGLFHGLAEHGRLGRSRR